jgi:hypothetical protein
MVSKLPNAFPLERVRRGQLYGHGRQKVVVSELAVGLVRLAQLLEWFPGKERGLQWILFHIV